MTEQPKTDGATPIVLGPPPGMNNESTKLNYEDKAQYGASFSDTDSVSHPLEHADTRSNQEDGIHRPS